MAWIKATYIPEGSGIDPLPTYINCDAIRAVRRTVDGKARILWRGGQPSQILCESYSIITKRIETGRT